MSSSVSSSSQSNPLNNTSFSGSSNLSSSGTNSSPVETIQKPPIVHETVRREEVEEIQPVIHREYERTKVIRTTLPLNDREIRTPIITTNGVAATYSRSVHGEFPAEYQQLLNSAAPGQSSFVVEREPIIIESVRHVVIEELRPVIYREIVYPSHVRGTYTVNEGTFHVDDSYRGLADQVYSSQIQGEVVQGQQWSRDVNGNQGTQGHNWFGSSSNSSNSSLGSDSSRYGLRHSQSTRDYDDDEYDFGDQSQHDAFGFNHPFYGHDQGFSGHDQGLSGQGYGAHCPYLNPYQSYHPSQFGYFPHHGFYNSGFQYPQHWQHDGSFQGDFMQGYPEHHWRNGMIGEHRRDFDQPSRSYSY